MIRRFLLLKKNDYLTNQEPIILVINQYKKLHKHIKIILDNNHNLFNNGMVLGQIVIHQMKVLFMDKFYKMVQMLSVGTLGMTLIHQIQIHTEEVAVANVLTQIDHKTFNKWIPVIGLYIMIKIIKDKIIKMINLIYIKEMFITMILDSIKIIQNQLINEAK